MAVDFDCGSLGASGAGLVVGGDFDGVGAVLGGGDGSCVTQSRDCTAGRSHGDSGIGGKLAGAVVKRADAELGIAA